MAYKTGRLASGSIHYLERRRMCSDLECGVCYQNYNAARRCPRELRCKHSFCERCLTLMSEPVQGSPCQGPVGIVCPLCREITSITSRRNIRAELRVDECVLERLMDAGLLNREDEDEEEEEEDGDATVQEREEGVPSGSPLNGSPAATTSKKVWQKIIRKVEKMLSISDVDVTSMSMGWMI